MNYILFFLCASDRDISLAYLIKKRIGYGNVYKIKDKKAVRYICKNKTGLSIILSLINGKFVSRFKYEQLIKHNYNKNFNFEILPPSNIISLDNYWNAGLVQAVLIYSLLSASRLRIKKKLL